MSRHKGVPVGSDGPLPPRWPVMSGPYGPPPEFLGRLHGLDLWATFIPSGELWLQAVYGPGAGHWMCLPSDALPGLEITSAGGEGSWMDEAYRRAKARGLVETSKKSRIPPYLSMGYIDQGHEAAEEFLLS